MAKKHNAVIMFSKALVESSERDQAVSVKMLWDFIAKKKGIKPKGKEHKLAEEFGAHFTGYIEEYRQYANAYGTLFQPEVFRGKLTPQQRREIKRLGFEAIKLRF